MLRRRLARTVVIERKSQGKSLRTVGALVCLAAKGQPFEHADGALELYFRIRINPGAPASLCFRCFYLFLIITLFTPLLVSMS